MKKQLVVLTGAGMSAESGIKTFRDADGLWEGHDIYEVATPEGFAKNPALVLDFYNQRRRQLLEVMPNSGHQNLVQLESNFDVHIVTQNVDDLHERAGSSSVLHLHGELRKVRSTIDEQLVYSWDRDINIGDTCEKGSQLRPHIVWFGEDVPLLNKAVTMVEKADIIAVIGTSMQVYPAAGLINYAKPDAQLFFIDPKPAISERDFNNLSIIRDTASSGTQKLLEVLV
ncbi:NAD-dependent protein deacylase [Tenacibaculum litopenaei]|jgi:NAD-dependent deacetylase|uniref:SIR2 family NAD-dependent protein deacylase n=1 Tax=Tenacibaculum litopenaei TaxID=396016 RepID=UPI0038930E39